MTPDDPRYPIGKFQAPPQFTAPLRRDFLTQIAEAPVRLREALRDLSEEHLDTPYRDGGWTIRQVVHHLADSHMNAYIRFKLAVTEDQPVIKPYDEVRWAALSDAALGDVEMSVTLLDALHQRWVAFLKSLEPDMMSRQFRHPERGMLSLDWTLALYAWHGRHHVAHITAWRRSAGV